MFVDIFLESDAGMSIYYFKCFTVDEVDGEDEPYLDDFDRLRSIREQHRREKHLQKLMARSVSAQQVTLKKCSIKNKVEPH